MPVPLKRATTDLPVCGGVFSNRTMFAGGSTNSTSPPSARRRPAISSAIAFSPSTSLLPDSIETRSRSVSR